MAPKSLRWAHGIATVAFALPAALDGVAGTARARARQAVDGGLWGRARAAGMVA